MLCINKYKKIICKFCDSKVVSKHFARHISRNHVDRREVRELNQYKPNSKERKQLLALMRNEGNLTEAEHGEIIPKRCQKNEKPTSGNYTLCVHCKGLFKKHSLHRHVKKCFAVKCHEPKQHALADSLIFTASQKALHTFLDKLAVKEHVLRKMHPDSIMSVVIEDELIVQFGNDLLKKTKTKRRLTHISNRLRECGRFLIQMRMIGNYTDMFSTMKPECVDDAILAVQKMASYDVENRSFKAPSLALHFRTTLTALASLAEKLIIRKTISMSPQTREKSLIELGRFSKQVEDHWAIEIGSLALKDLEEKRSTKPKLLPITEDIITLKKSVEKKAEEAYQSLKNTATPEEYKTLAECTLVLTIIHNRKRVGDIQFLDINTYEREIELNTQNTQDEMLRSLTENERILTQSYQRIISIGKGSRCVPVLVPRTQQRYYSMLVNIRRKKQWFLPENTYLFAYPDSLRWIDGSYVMRKYAKDCGAKKPNLITSSRLRKHIATVTQVLSLKPNEVDQLAKFMGHTTRTHEQFYK